MRKIKCRKCGKIVEAEGAQALCPSCREEARHKSSIAPRTCRACGIVFPGGPRAWYCPDCRLERRREADKKSKQRKAAGRARSIGSTDLCEICGKPYTVNGSLQRYCPNCAKAATDAVARQQKRDYAASHRAEYAARKADYTRSRRVCAVCGSSFYAPTPRVTCPGRCARILRSYNQAYADHLRRGSPEPTLEDVAARLDRASGVNGVSRSKNGKRWVARADNKHLGTFDTIEQAQYALVSTNTDNALFFLSDGEIFVQIEHSGEFCRGTLDEFLAKSPANRLRITQERAEALANAARLLLSGNN